MIAAVHDPTVTPKDAAGRWYAVQLLAAGLLLRHWQAKGARSVRLERNDDGVDRVEPDVVNGAAGWAPDAAEAAAALVATVLLGARYAGWQVALQAAAAEMGGEA